mmetsp:Transcript_9762/g.30980  ORF Transcript_9762/g.30980 Transcript_9762/m.30980 type:complete len:484 (+) Transcript_9762:401-1852(+)
MEAQDAVGAHLVLGRPGAVVDAGRWALEAPTARLDRTPAALHPAAWPLAALGASASPTLFCATDLAGPAEDTSGALYLLVVGVATLGGGVGRSKAAPGGARARGLQEGSHFKNPQLLLDKVPVRLFVGGQPVTREGQSKPLPHPAVRGLKHDCDAKVLDCCSVPVGFRPARQGVGKVRSEADVCKRPLSSHVGNRCLRMCVGFGSRSAWQGPHRAALHPHGPVPDVVVVGHRVGEALEDGAVELQGQLRHLLQLPGLLQSACRAPRGPHLGPPQQLPGHLGPKQCRLRLAQNEPDGRQRQQGLGAPLAPVEDLGRHARVAQHLLLEGPQQLVEQERRFLGAHAPDRCLGLQRQRPHSRLTSCCSKVGCGGPSGRHERGPARVCQPRRRQRGPGAVLHPWRPAAEYPRCLGAAAARDVLRLERLEPGEQARANSDAVCEMQGRGYGCNARDATLEAAERRQLTHLPAEVLLIYLHVVLIQLVGE